jgi:hypothetical protein
MALARLKPSSGRAKGRLVERPLVQRLSNRQPLEVELVACRRPVLLAGV